jgi:hypothetical protein
VTIASVHERLRFLLEVVALELQHLRGTDQLI